MKTFKGKNNEVLGTFLENADVVVNPALSGDEPEMTGIQVGGQKYKAPQGGGASVGSPYIVTIQDLRDITVGAHLDVEATISLIQELGLETTLTSQTNYTGISVSKDGQFEPRIYVTPFTFRYYDCALEYEINVFGKSFGFGNENNIITALRSKKAEIESHIVSEGSWNDEIPAIGVLAVVNNTSSNVLKGSLRYLPLEKLRSIFVKDNA